MNVTMVTCCQPFLSIFVDRASAIPILHIGGPISVIAFDKESFLSLLASRIMFSVTDGDILMYIYPTIMNTTSNTPSANTLILLDLPAEILLNTTSHVEILYQMWHCSYLATFEQH